ncbi:hypothetical protein R6Q59_020188 [Mikania micrantha]
MLEFKCREGGGLMKVVAVVVDSPEFGGSVAAGADQVAVGRNGGVDDGVDSSEVVVAGDCDDIHSRDHPYYVFANFLATSDSNATAVSGSSRLSSSSPATVYSSKTIIGGLSSLFSSSSSFTGSGS